MKKWSRQIALTALSVCLCVVTLSSAKAGDYTNYNCCEPYDCCGNSCSLDGLEVGAEFIWWKPALDHLEYAVVIDRSVKDAQKFKYKTLCPDWEPGGRIWAYAPSVFGGCCGLGASWTGICSKYSTSTSIEIGDSSIRIEIPLEGSSLQGGGFIAQNVKARSKFNYNDYDVLFSYSCCCGDSSIFRPFFGFAGLVLDQKVNVIGEAFNVKVVLEANEVVPDVTMDIKWKSNLSAYGLRVGTEYECKLADCLSLFGKFSASVLTGKPDTKNIQKFMNTSTPSNNRDDNITEDECYRAYPGYHLATGVIYNTCYCDMNLSARVGYEFIEWYNLPHPRTFINHIPSQGVGSSDRTFGWQGVTIGASVTF